MAGGRREALTRARTRRIVLDRDRAARDSRVEAGTAEVFLLLDQRELARRAVHRVEEQLGQALVGLLAEGLAVSQVGSLCEITATECRRLTRLAAVAAAVRRSPGSPQK